jgi:hypothetical protein
MNSEGDGHSGEGGQYNEARRIHGGMAEPKRIDSSLRSDCLRQAVDSILRTRATSVHTFSLPV